MKGKIGRKIGLMVAVLLVVLSAWCYAYQPDAPFLAFQEKHKAEWAQQCLPSAEVAQVNTFG